MSRQAGIALGLVLLFLLPPGLNAQQLPEESDWNNLNRLQVSQRIAVKTKDNITHYGKFLAYSDEAISLREGKQEVGYRREEVVRVSLLGPPDRGKAALYGFLFTFAGATTITAAKIGGEEDLVASGKVVISVGIGALFGGIGAGIGAAAAPSSKIVIYRAQP